MPLDTCDVMFNWSISLLPSIVLDYLVQKEPNVGTGKLVLILVQTLEYDTSSQETHQDEEEEEDQTVLNLVPR